MTNDNVKPSDYELFKAKKWAEGEVERLRYIAEGTERRASAKRIEEEQQRIETARLEASNRVFVDQETQRKLSEEVKDAANAKEAATYQKLAEDRITANRVEAARQEEVNAKLRSLMQATPEERAKLNAEADAICIARSRERQAEASTAYAAELEVQERQANAAKYDYRMREEASHVAIAQIRNREAQEVSAYIEATTKNCETCHALVPKEAAVHRNIVTGEVCYADLCMCKAAGITMPMELKGK